MLKRKFYDTLIDWKKTKKNECLLVNGARQVGKTFIIDKFARENYKSYIYINLFKNPEYAGIFEGSLEAPEIYKRISLYVQNVNLIEKDTLIFIDEIQVSASARTALKFLAIDGRYDVVASGSLLGIHYNKSDANANQPVSIPVGYERELEMFSLDFEEFLWANGITEESIASLKSYFDKKEKVPPEVNEKFLGKLREYMVVGGMPEVVNRFIETSNFQEVHSAQEKILKSYEDDIQLYATNPEKPKIKNCYYSIPRQLAKEYTKFQYKTVEKNGTAKKYGNSLAWLEDSGLINLLHNVSLPVMPLAAYEVPESFKVYASDIGLLTSMFGFETQAALIKKTLTGPAKGGIYENLIFDILHKRGFKLYYYKKNDSLEIEFLFEKEGSAIPVEVKSKKGENVSLNSFIADFNPAFAYKLIDGNIGVSGNKITVPQYMAMFI